MSSGAKISPNDTYVLDENLLDEMDSIELTGLLNELSAQLGAEHDPEPADEASEADSELLENDDSMTIDIEVDADFTDD